MLLACWWWLLGRWAFWRLAVSRLCSRWMAVGAAGNASHALLGWSSGFLGVPAASVLYQAWPLFALLLTGLLFHREGRFQHLDGRLAFLLLLGLGGVGMVVSGQVGELWFLSVGFAWSLAPGVTLALLSGIVGGSSVACTLRWAVDLSRGLGPRLLRGVSPSGLELPCTLLGYCLGQLLFLLPHGAVGLAAGDSFTPSLCLFGFLGGLALCCTSALWQCANLLVVRRAGVNVSGTWPLPSPCCGFSSRAEGECRVGTGCCWASPGCLRLTWKLDFSPSVFRVVRPLPSWLCRSGFWSCWDGRCCGAELPGVRRR